MVNPDEDAIDARVVTWGFEHIAGMHGDPTTHSVNVIEDWDWQDLLANLLNAGTRKIRVIAWLFGYCHGGAPAAHPKWPR